LLRVISATGSLGPPPSTASVVLQLGLLVLAFAAIAIVAGRRRRREAPLRREMRARPEVTFRASVDVKVSFLGMMLAARGRLQLIVRGDAFEVTHPFPLARVIFGQEYCYLAKETTVEAVTGLRRGLIEINGRPAGTGARIRIGQRNMDDEIWDALIQAGAEPVGPGPSGGAL
jgi:hypothetical protein